MNQAIAIMCLLFGVVGHNLATPLMLQHNKTNVLIQGKINLDEQYSLFISSMDPSSTDQIEEEIDVQKDGNFKWNGYTSKPQFITVSFTPKKRDRQLGATFPLYLRPGMKLDIDLNYSPTEYLTLRSGKMDHANKALFQYANFSNNRIKELFVNPPSIGESKAFTKRYLDEADRWTQGFEKKDNIVKEYLTIWAFNNYQDALHNLAREHSRKDKNISLPEGFYNLPKSPKEIYDSNLSLIIPQSIGHINQYLAALQKDKLSTYDELYAKIESLKRAFKNEQLIENVGTSLLTSYITSYRITQKGFQEDIKDFEKAALIIRHKEKRDQIVHDFENLKYTLVGAEMPDVLFKDANGKEISLHSFKGKYVYIDLWASWCVPCIAEIPHLQKLEKEYADKNIVFISLSIDGSSSAWKNKVKELDLHGNQFEQGNSKFDKLMNVTGIPHFVLYNPEGKLELYKAPRPSAAVIKTLFDQLL